MRRHCQHAAGMHQRAQAGLPISSRFRRLRLELRSRRNRGAARRSYVEENLEITRKFIKAYVEGMHRYRTDRDFTIGVQAEYSGIADRTIAEETYDLTRPGMPAVPYPVVSSLQTLLNFMSR